MRSCQALLFWKSGWRWYPPGGGGGAHYAWGITRWLPKFVIYICLRPETTYDRNMKLTPETKYHNENKIAPKMVGNFVANALNNFYGFTRFEVHCILFRSIWCQAAGLWTFLVNKNASPHWGTNLMSNVETHSWKFFCNIDAATKLNFIFLEYIMNPLEVDFNRNASLGMIVLNRRVGMCCPSTDSLFKLYLLAVFKFSEGHIVIIGENKYPLSICCM